MPIMYTAGKNVKAMRQAVSANGIADDIFRKESIGKQAASRLGVT